MSASTEILCALQKRHGPRFNGDAANWVFFREVRVGVGFGPGMDQRIDAWAINCWKPREMVAYEVKVSRSDFLREMKQPQKRRMALLYSNRFYFATPAGLIDEHEVPPECGLIEVHADGGAAVKVEAPWRDCHPPSWHFLASIARRVAKLTTGAEVVE